MRLLLMILLAALFSSSYCQQPFSLPLGPMKLTSAFGLRRHPILGRTDYHTGIDLSARTEPVLAVLGGKVHRAGYDAMLGHYVRVCHGNIESIYGHLRLVCVQAGQDVDAGQLLGVTGSSGRSTGEHLHFSVKLDGRYIDPLGFLLALQRRGNL